MKSDNFNSKNCNEFLIKDGKFIREFEKMYKVIKDPWSQEKNSDSDIHFLSACCWLQQFIKSNTFKIESILDIGCANGYQSEGLVDSTKAKYYTGIDVSSTIIQNASVKYGSCNRIFEVNDISKYNQKYKLKFDFIFSSRTLYYVAPEIKQVLENIDAYLKPKGIFCFIYNQKPDSFTNKWLTYKKLDKFLKKLYTRIMFAELSDNSDECIAIGIYQK